MTRVFTLIACVAGLALPALAQSPSAIAPSVVHAVELIDATEVGSVVLFAITPEGQAGGGVVSNDGDVLCDAGWSARLAAQDNRLRFNDIAVLPANCGSDAQLQDFTDRLSRVEGERATDEGIELLDQNGSPLLRLRVAG